METISNWLVVLIIIFSLAACIGDDIIEDRVPAKLRITNPIDSLKEGEQYQLEYMYTNIIGVEEEADVAFSSSNPDVASINMTGLVDGIAEGGTVITLSADSEDGLLLATLSLGVGQNTVIANSERTGTAMTTSSYLLEGSFRLFEDGSELKLAFESDWKATSALPGLYVYLTNNPNSNANALEISEVTTFSGAHEYNIPAGVGLNDYSHVLFYCKPFGVKVGDGPFDN